MGFAGGDRVLDIVFRLERRFGVRLEPSYFDQLGRKRNYNELTAGDLFDVVSCSL